MEPPFGRGGHNADMDEDLLELQVGRLRLPRCKTQSHQMPALKPHQQGPTQTNSGQHKHLPELLLPRSTIPTTGTVRL